MSRIPVVMLCLLLPACSVAEPSCDNGSPLAGRWRYSARQESPVPGSASGTMTIAATCEIVTGEFDVIETDGFGGTRRLAGRLSGRIFDDGTIRFEAELPSGTRQHLGTIRGDSLDGSWASMTGTIAASGSFGGRRQ